MKSTSNVAPHGTGFLLGITAVALTLMLGAAPVAAAGACAAHEAVAKQLEHRYAEAPVARGLAQSGKLLQVFSAKDGQTWTVVMIRPDGISCIVATGRFWQEVTPKAEPQV